VWPHLDCGSYRDATACIIVGADLEPAAGAGERRSEPTQEKSFGTNKGDASIGIVSDRAASVLPSLTLCSRFLLERLRASIGELVNRARYRANRSGHVYGLAGIVHLDNNRAARLHNLDDVLARFVYLN
jgi:hypothetical protein